MENVDFYIKRGDLSPPIRTTLKDNAGAPVDLTGLSVMFYMRSFISGELIVSGEAAIDGQPTTGKVTYNWQEGETEDTGYHFAEWEVQLAPGQTQTFPTNGWNLIDVVEDLDSLTVTNAGFLELRQLRSMVAEPTRNIYSDSLLFAMMLRHSLDLNGTAAEIWREKAAEAAALTDIGTGDKKRALSQLYPRFIKQAEIYEAAAGDGPSVTGAQPTIVRNIERV